MQARALSRGTAKGLVVSRRQLHNNRAGAGNGSDDCRLTKRRRRARLASVGAARVLTWGDPYRRHGVLSPCAVVKHSDDAGGGQAALTTYETFLLIFCSQLVASSTFVLLPCDGATLEPGWLGAVESPTSRDDQLAEPP
jgi:hypothetical protein